jgi:HD domain
LRSESSRPAAGGSGAAAPGERAESLIPGFAAESDLERALIADPDLREGLAWGRPRSGHPEGSVGAHVADLLGTIDRWGETGQRRAELRFLALLHDSMKCRVRDWLPKTGENHHAMRARRLAERYTTDERLLATIEHHDRPYALWRRLRRTGRMNEKRLDRMLEQIPDIDLFVRFVELDGSTVGKKAGPIEWLKEEVGRRGRG